MDGAYKILCSHNSTKAMVENVLIPLEADAGTKIAIDKPIILVM